MKKHWFIRKQYGWGWQPVTWQGWLVVLLYTIAIARSFLIADNKSHSSSDTLINFALPFIFWTLILIFICYKTGEKPKWQWGSRGIDKKS